MKKTLTFVISIFLFISCFFINEKEINAAGYRVELVRGYGREVAGEKATYIFENGIDTGYSLIGSFAGEVDQSGPNTTKRYSQKTSAETKVTGVDVYYGDKALYNITGGLLIKEDGSLTSTVSSNATRILKFAISDTTFFCRFYYVADDLTIVLHYANENKLSIENINDYSSNETYDTYLKDENESYILGNYNLAEGLNININPLDKEIDRINFELDDKKLSLSRFDNTYYLSNNYLFSNIHNDDDILTYDKNNITIYNANSDININYEYRNNIIFDAAEGKFEDGTNIYSTLTYNNKIDYPKDPKKENTNFAGWYDINDYKVTNDTFTEDTSLKAVYSKNIYTVTFDLNKKAENIIETVAENYKLKGDIIPEIDGYTFMGWYSDSEYKNAYDFSKAITSNTTIYGKYLKIISVRFNNAKSIISTSFESQIKDNGYIDYDNNRIILFDNFKNENGISVVVNNYEGNIKDILITNGSRKVKINKNDIENNTTVYVGKWFWKRKTGNKNSILKFVHSNKANKNEAFTITLYNIKKDIDININYADVNLTYVLDGKSYDKIIPYNSTLDIVAPEKEGAIFKGWYMDENYLNEFKIDNRITNDITLYGKYEINHEIRFENINKLSSSNWNRVTGGEINENSLISLGDYSSSEGIQATIFCDIENMKAIEFEYEGFKTRVDKADLYETHILDKNFDFVDKSKYENGDLLRMYMSKEAKNQITIRFFNILSDMKITIVK